MRHFLPVLFLVVSMVGSFLFLKHSPTTSQGNEEGYGVNPQSRKYFEYLRQRNPLTGRVEADMRRKVARFVSRLPHKENSRQVEWTSRGPFNKGGRTRSLAIDVTDDNILLAGSVTGGVWRTDDAGQSWTKTITPDQLHSASCIVQDTRPGHEDTWYFGTGEEFYGVVSGTSFTSLFSGDGIFKSTDGGHSWQQLTSTSSGTPEDVLQNGSYDFVWNMCVDHTNLDEDEVYAAVYNGVIRSMDGGDTWEQVLGFGSAAADFTDLIITSEGVLYAAFSNDGTTNGIWRSTNGVNWYDIGPTFSGNYRRIVMDYNPQNPDEVYFLMEGNTSQNDLGHMLWKYTYESGNGVGAGGTWEDRSANLPDDPCELDLGNTIEFGKFKSQSSYDLCIRHHPTEDGVLFIGGTNIERSATSFAEDDHRWIGGYRCNVQNPVNYVYPNHHPDQHYMLFSPTDSDVMYSANDGGIYRTDDAMADSVEWVSLNNGYVSTQFYTVAMEQGHAETDYVFGGMQDNGTWITSTVNPGDNWHEVHSDDGSYGALPEARNFIISSSQLGKMFKKTIDVNGQLLSTERIDPINGPSSLFVNPLLLDPVTNNDLYMAGNKTIWWMPNVSDLPVTGNYIDQLDNDYWTNITESNIPLPAGSISCMDKPILLNSRIYYGSSGGYLYRLDDCFAETAVKTNITSDLFPNGAYMSCVSANDVVPDEVVCSFSNYGIQSIFHSTDAGTNWENISGNLEENVDGSGSGPGVYWVEIYPSDPPVYFAGTSAGLFSTTTLDGESTIWEMEGAESIGNVIINMIAIRPYDGKIAVGTHGNGIYTGQLSAVEAVSVSPVSQGRESEEAWPNPFHEQVNIPFVSPSGTQVEMAIYSLDGRLLYNETKRSVGGRQQFLWHPDPGTIPGTYLYTITSGQQKKQGKLIYR